MFQCQCGCNTMSAPREKQLTVPVEGRQRFYTSAGPHDTDSRDERPIIAEGWEIVREVVVKQSHFDKM